MEGERLDLGERIATLRRKLGLTQAQLAEPRFKASYVSLVEAGKRQPSETAIRYFADKLGISVEQLVEGGAHDLRARLEQRLMEARRKVSAGELDGARADYEEIRAKAAALHAVRLQASAVEGLALCAERALDMETAIDLFDEATALLTREPVAARVDAVAGKARCVQHAGDTRYAIHLLESLLARLEEEGTPDPSSLMRIHGTLVHPYRTAGMPTQSARSAQAALSLAPQVEDPIRLAAMYVNASASLLQQGAPGDARDALLRARDLYTQAELKTEMGRAHLCLGIVQAEEGELDNARRELTAALRIFEQTESRLDIAGTLFELARVERENGNVEGARPLLERSMSVVEQGDIIGLAIIHRELGLCDVSSDPLNAEKHLRVAVDLFEQGEAFRQVVKARRLLGDLYADRGEAAQATEEYRTAALLAEEKFPTV